MPILPFGDMLETMGEPGEKGISHKGPRPHPSHSRLEDEVAVIALWEQHAGMLERGGRLRATRGWKTARQADAALPEATARVSRTRFWNAARCAIAMAVQHYRTVRERRLAERQAILKTLECYNLLQRTRGPAPNRPVKSEVVS